MITHFATPAQAIACALHGILLDYSLSSLIRVADALLMRPDVASLDQEEALPIPRPPETFIIDPEIQSATDLWVVPVFTAVRA